MYHEGNPGARILGGVCIMKELLGNKFLTNMSFFVFFPKKPGARCMYHEPKIIKNPGKIVSRTIPQDFPSPRFFWKKPSKREKNTILCGARMSLENEFPWRTNFPGERILGKPPGKNRGEKHYGETTTWKIPICFYVLEKFWRENPPGKSQFVYIMRWNNSGEKTPSENSGKQTFSSLFNTFLSQYVC